MSQRTSPDPAFDGPYDGLPPWLFQSVAAWLNSIVYSGPLGRPNEALLRDAEVVLHLDPPLNWHSGGHSAISTVLNRMQTDGDFALDFLDYLLNTPWTDPRLAVQLDQILTRGGSSWEVHSVGSPAPFQLVRREIDPVKEAIEGIRPVSQRAHAHLVQAWSKLMGRNPDPSTAYREAIRAVEVVAAPVVIPDDNLATLGKIIRAIQDKPDKWTVDLVEATPDQVADMAAMIWQAQFDRHGTHDENVPLSVSHEQADAAGARSDRARPAVRWRPRQTHVGLSRVSGPARRASGLRWDLPVVEPGFVACVTSAARRPVCDLQSGDMAKRAYGSGRLFVYTDKADRESWYGSWRAGARRVQRKIGPKRPPGGARGLTRVQAERELRRRIDHDLILPLRNARRSRTLARSTSTTSSM